MSTYAFARKSKTAKLSKRAKNILNIFDEFIFEYPTMKKELCFFAYYKIIAEQ